MRCDDYDYIEIVCMYHYPIKLTLRSGIIIEGIALDTAVNASRTECIKMMVGETESFVELDDIKQLIVTVHNPHFTEKTFI